jgi:hypothetical protein
MTGGIGFALFCLGCKAELVTFDITKWESLERISGDCSKCNKHFDVDVGLKRWQEKPIHVKINGKKLRRKIKIKKNENYR